MDLAMLPRTFCKTVKVLAYILISTLIKQTVLVKSLSLIKKVQEH